MRRALFLFAIVLNAQTFQTLATQAQQAREADHLEQAAALYAKALGLKPTWAEGWFSLGTIEYDWNRYAQAAQAFGKAAKLDGKVGTSRVMLGLCEFELGQEAAALMHLQEGLRLGIADSEQLRHVAVFHEGVLLQRSGKFEAALDALGPLCAAGVESAELDQTIGLAALRLRDKEAASQVAAHIGHAECLGAHKQFDEAHAAYKAALAEAPRIPNVHYAYGRFLLNVANDPESAVAEFKLEIANQPQSALARLQIAAAEYKVDSAAGVPYAEEAVKLNPGLPLGHYLLGLLRVDLGDYEKAIPQLELARKELPKEPGIYYALGNAYARTGRSAEAAEARAQFEQLKDSPSATSFVPKR